MSLRSAVLAIALAALAATAPAAELTVSAAASLGNAFAEIKVGYEAIHPGIRVRLNHGASGALLQQIANGAPVDVFASADQETMDEAGRRGLVRAGERANFARNTLVVVVPADAAAVPGTLAALAAPGFRRIAIGLPASVPAGRYARAALENAGLWQRIEPRVIGAQSVRQVLDYVARGEVDAGFVYATDAALLAGRVRTAFAVATPVPIVYPAAPLLGAADPAAARRFVDHLLGPQAQSVLARHGFAKP